MAPKSERGQCSIYLVEQLTDLMAALSLNKALLARILRVSGPTIDEWFAGRQPAEKDQNRLQRISTILAYGSVSAVMPLNARLVRRSLGPGLPSLIDLLSNEHIEPTRILSAIGHVRVLTEDAEHRRGKREKWLRELGFEEPSQCWRRETLARNVALLDRLKG